MGSETAKASDPAQMMEAEEAGQPIRARSADPDSEAPGGDSIDANLEAALERVAHGATVSMPAVLVQMGLLFAFTAILTNGFGAAAYGLYAVARRFQTYLVELAGGFKRGLSRFLPAATPAEQELLATFASVLMVSVATAFGIGLFLATPDLTQMTGRGAQFQVFLQLFAVGLPAAAWLEIVAAMYRGFEEVGLFNLIIRVGVPAAQLIVGAIGVFVFQDLVLVGVGVLVTFGLLGLVGAGVLARRRGLRPRLRRGGASGIRRRYVGFTAPLFAGKFATTTQHLGYYPLIAFLLSDVAGGVFAVGILVGSIIRLPLIGVNQFIPPIAAELHDENHRRTLGQVYTVTSRLVVIGVLGLAIPVIVYRVAVMQLFGPTFVEYAPLLPWFVLGEVAAATSGSVGILLIMTDHQRAFLTSNVVLTGFMLVTAIPMTVLFGLPGMVGSYCLVLVGNNALQVAVLYRLEGFQPVTRLYATPLGAAIPFVLLTLAVRRLVPPPTAVVVGSVLGLFAYASTLRILGFTEIERRLAMSLIARYREAIRSAGDRRSLFLIKNRPAPVLTFIGICIALLGVGKAVVP